MAIAKANRYGVLFVSSAGNEGRNSDQIAYYPASYSLDNIVSVASTNYNNKLLPSINFGYKTVDIAAPGLGIYSTVPQRGYARMSGTSQSTAFVSGVLAIIISKHGFKSAIHRLLKSTDNLDFPIKSRGKVNAKKALAE